MDNIIVNKETSLFDNIENNKNDIITDNNCNLEIIVESRGRKKNTYLTGWLNDKDKLKEHLKKLKRKIGCNGSVKKMNKEDNKFIFHLQGDRKDLLFEYLTNSKDNNDKVESKFITIKG